MSADRADRMAVIIIVSVILLSWAIGAAWDWAAA
jgi:hypothetical protein